MKCSHGSTVGELDAEHLFYLRSRGLDEDHAREILTTAFAATVIERIAAPDIRATRRRQGRRALCARSRRSRDEPRRRPRHVDPR